MVLTVHRSVSVVMARYVILLQASVNVSHTAIMILDVVKVNHSLLSVYVV